MAQITIPKPYKQQFIPKANAPSTSAGIIRQSNEQAPRSIYRTVREPAPPHWSGK